MGSGMGGNDSSLGGGAGGHHPTRTGEILDPNTSTSGMSGGVGGGDSSYGVRACPQTLHFPRVVTDIPL